MIVKKFYVHDMKEGMLRIREELGSDAVILQSRKVRGGRGLFKFMRPSQLEITVAVEEKSINNVKEPETLDRQEFEQRFQEMLAEVRSSINQIALLSARSTEAEPAAPAPQAAPTATELSQHMAPAVSAMSPPELLTPVLPPSAATSPYISAAYASAKSESELSSSVLPPSAAPHAYSSAAPVTEHATPVLPSLSGAGTGAEPVTETGPGSEPGIAVVTPLPAPEVAPDPASAPGFAQELASVQTDAPPFTSAPDFTSVPPAPASAPGHAHESAPPELTSAPGCAHASASASCLASAPDLGLTPPVPESATSFPSDQAPAAEIKARVKPELERWQQRLEGQDLDPFLVGELLGEIAENLQGEIKLPDKIINLILRKGLRQRLKTAPEKGAAIQVFVGPTGVGKSTTLAKLAARYALYQGEKVGIITIDHYRIGAIEQMRTYSDITGLPLEVVMSPKELRSAVEKFSGCQRILIDTAGRSSRNLPHIQELAGYIQKLPPCEIFLVISATTKRQDLQLISENFRLLAYNRIIYTKLDETSSYGILLNGSYMTDTPVIYMTNGQSVPDDICLADIETMSSLILGEDE